MLKISTLHMPLSYVSTQIEIARRVIEGREGMASVLEHDDPTFVIIAGKTSRGIDAMIREQSGTLDKFTKRPIDVPFLVSA